MSEGFKRSTFMSKLDELLDEYAAHKTENKGDVYINVTNQPANDELNCRFKDTCYALKNKMGICPCEFSK